MDNIIQNGKFKIFFLNTFLILYKAATLSPYKLRVDLREVNIVLLSVISKETSLAQQLLVVCISCFLVVKFLIGYAGLTANTIAVFPIITKKQSELLWPTIVVQSVEFILLNMVELLIGYITVRYFIVDKMPMFIIFLMKNLIHMSMGIMVLDIYTDLYSEIKFGTNASLSDTALDADYSAEFLVAEHCLIDVENRQFMED